MREIKKSFFILGHFFFQVIYVSVGFISKRVFLMEVKSERSRVLMERTTLFRIGFVVLGGKARGGVSFCFLSIDFSLFSAKTKKRSEKIENEGAVYKREREKSRSSPSSLSRNRLLRVFIVYVF